MDDQSLKDKLMANKLRELDGFPIPDFRKEFAQMVKAATPEMGHRFESASELIKHIGLQISLWRKHLPEDGEMVILAFLFGGQMIAVKTIQAQGHHGIVVVGWVADAANLKAEPENECMIVLHQSQLQLLFFARKRADPERRTMGFGAVYDEKGKQAA